MFPVRPVPRCYKRDKLEAAFSLSVMRRVSVKWPPAWEFDSGSNESVVGYSSAGKNVSRGHCYDPLPGND
jgi:hypothetical protein